MPDYTGADAMKEAAHVPREFWDLVHEWSSSSDEERRDWIEHRFDELFALAKVEAQPAAVAGEAEVRWERQQALGDGAGTLIWQGWEPCTAAEAERVSGLRTWMVRKFVGVLAPAAPSVGEPAQDYLARVEADPLRAAALQRARERAASPAAPRPTLIGTNAGEFKFSFAWDGLGEPRVTVTNGRFKNIVHYADMFDAVADRVIEYAEQLRKASKGEQKAGSVHPSAAGAGNAGVKNAE